MSFRQTKKIYLLGWYGKGGLADDIIGECITKALFGKAREKEINIDFVEKINESDLVVVGGGSLLGFDSLKLSNKLKKIEKPIVIFGAGYRREKRILNEKSRNTFKKVLSKVSLIGVRGYVSKQMLLQNGIIEDGEVEVVGDPALLFSPTSVRNFEGEFRIGMVARNMSRFEPQYVTNNIMQRTFAALGDYLAQRFKAKIYFFSFTENIFESDIKGAKKVLKFMKHGNQAEIIPRINEPRKLGSMMGKMNLVVSQRLHPSVLAWVQEVPSIAFEYQFNKTIDVMNSIGMDEFVIRTDEFSLDSYIKKLDRLLKEKEIIMSQAKISVDYWKKRLSNFAERTLDILA